MTGNLEADKKEITSQMHLAIGMYVPVSEKRKEVCLDLEAI